MPTPITDQVANELKFTMANVALQEAQKKWQYKLADRFQQLPFVPNPNTKVTEKVNEAFAGFKPMIENMRTAETAMTTNASVWVMQQNPQLAAIANVPGAATLMGPMQEKIQREIQASIASQLSQQLRPIVAQATREYINGDKDARDDIMKKAQTKIQERMEIITPGTPAFERDKGATYNQMMQQAQSQSPTLSAMRNVSEGITRLKEAGIDVSKLNLNVESEEILGQIAAQLKDKPQQLAAMMQDQGNSIFAALGQVTTSLGQLGITPQQLAQNPAMLGGIVNALSPQQQTQQQQNNPQQQTRVVEKQVPVSPQLKGQVQDFITTLEQVSPGLGAKVATSQDPFTDIATALQQKQEMQGAVIEKFKALAKSLGKDPQQLMGDKEAMKQFVQQVVGIQSGAQSITIRTTETVNTPTPTTQNSVPLTREQELTKGLFESLQKTGLTLEQIKASPEPLRLIQEKLGNNYNAFQAQAAELAGLKGIETSELLTKPEVLKGFVAKVADDYTKLPKQAEQTQQQQQQQQSAPYTVKSGDTLSGIALKDPQFKEALDAMKKKNPGMNDQQASYQLALVMAKVNDIDNPNRIMPGQSVRVPTPAEIAAGGIVNGTTVQVNGTTVQNQNPQIPTPQQTQKREERTETRTVERDGVYTFKVGEETYVALAKDARAGGFNGMASLENLQAFRVQDGKIVGEAVSSKEVLEGLKKGYDDKKQEQLQNSQIAQQKKNESEQREFNSVSPVQAANALNADVKATIAFQNTVQGVNADGKIVGINKFGNTNSLSDTVFQSGGKEYYADFNQGAGRQTGTTTNAGSYTVFDKSGAKVELNQQMRADLQQDLDQRMLNLRRVENPVITDPKIKAELDRVLADLQKDAYAVGGLSPMVGAGQQQNQTRER